MSDAATSGDPGTLTGGEGDTPSAPQTWPDTWRADMIGGDMAAIEADEGLSKQYKQLERYNSPQDIWAKTTNLEAEFSKRAPRLEYAEDMPDDKLAQYREQEGIPKTSKDYSLEFESGMVIGENDKPFVDSFLEYAHGANMPESHVKNTLEWYMTDKEAQAESLEQKISESRYESGTQLKSEWGGEYEGNINAINELFVDNPELHDIIMKSVDKDGLPIGNNAQVVRWASDLGKRLNPTATMTLPGGDSGVQALGTRITEIEHIINTDREAYNKNSAMQDEYLVLLEKKEALDNRKK